MCNKAIQLDPDDSYPYSNKGINDFYNLGNSLRILKLYDEALQMID